MSYVRYTGRLDLHCCEPGCTETTTVEGTGYEDCKRRAAHRQWWVSQRTAGGKLVCRCPMHLGHRLSGMRDERILQPTLLGNGNNHVTRKPIGST